MTHWQKGVIPLSEWPKNTTLNWTVHRDWRNAPYTGTDSDINYWKFKETGFQKYGPDDISYVLNSHGYRSIEPDPTSPHKKVMFVGCSFAFGDALPYQDVWTSVAVERLKAHYGTEIEQHNFGLPGLSNDAFAQIVYQTVPVLKPDLLVVLFTQHSRRAHFRNAEERIRLTPHSSHHDPAFRAYIQLQNEANDTFNFVQNWRMIDMVARMNKIPWLWQGIYYSHWLDYEQYGVSSANRMPLWDDFPSVNDFARDGAHPGPNANRTFGERLADIVIDEKLL